MNVVPFSDFDSDRQVQAHQLGLPRIILEGDDDVRLFKRWFSHLSEDLEFIQAREVGPGAGCMAVAPAVRVSREDDGIPAVGIVDRDTVHRAKEWATVFETDDEVFARDTRTEAVYTTLLWEVEAYLIQPALLSDWAETQARRLPAPARAAGDALAHSVEECEALLAATPFYAATHDVGEHRMPPGHFLNIGCAELAEACARHDARANPRHEQAEAVITPLVEAVRRHAPDDAAERLVFYLRYVDTKRLLARLNRRLDLREGAKWGLQTLMSGRGLRPVELEAFLTATAERYAA